MSESIKSPEDIFNKLGMVFHTMLAIPLLPFVFLYLEIKNNGFTGVLPPSGSTMILNYAVSLVAGILIVQGMRSTKSASMIARHEVLLKDKLQVYFKGTRKFYLYVGLACSLLSLTLWMTASGVLVVSYVIILFVMSLNRPTTKRFIKDLQLTGEEREAVLNKNASF